MQKQTTSKKATINLFYLNLVPVSVLQLLSEMLAFRCGIRRELKFTSRLGATGHFLDFTTKLDQFISCKN